MKTMKTINIAPTLTLDEKDTTQRRLAHDHMRQHGLPDNENVLDSTIYRCGLDYLRLLQQFKDKEVKP